jgi:EpsI family protein
MSSPLNRRDFVIGGVLTGTALLCAGVAPGRSPLIKRRTLDHLVPQQIGPWTASRYEPVVIPRGEEPEGLSYDSVITRYYVSDSALPIMLLIAYGSAQTGETQLHRPEVCYVAAGFRMHSWPNVMLRTAERKIDARVLTATAPGRTDQILYWTRVGGEFPTTSIEQRWSTLRQTLKGSVPDGVLVRISVDEEDRATAMKFMRTFAADLLSSGGTRLRAILEGAA